jgi:uncharacterized membrane protein YcfT
MSNSVMRLREALEPELTRLVQTARAVDPAVDGVTMGSLLTLYGIEIGLTVGEVGRSLMANYLRQIAEALDEEADALPTLGRIAAEDSDEPAF